MPESKEATKDTTNDRKGGLSPVEAELMSREIKFRQAITEDDGTFHWHYWGYLHTCTKGLPVFINPMPPLEHDLRPSYQYTGHKTKGGVKIWDGSMILTNPKGYEYRYVIRWNNDHGCWSTYSADSPWGQLDGAEAEGCEVIGNTEETPELLKAIYGAKAAS